MTQQDDDHLLSLRYPRDIARLPNVYQDDRIQSPSANETSAQEDPNRLSLRNSFDSTNPFVRQDSPEAFSEKLSPASQQAALLAISRALRREPAKYAGIAATDVLDTLFIAGFLRSANRDLRLFTLDSDLLFERENENTPLTGLLSVTTYPLFGRNQHWTHAQLTNGIPRRAQFTSRDAEGVYNAARWLLVPYVFRHLRNLLGFVIGGFILAILATTVYPFQGERWLAFTGAVAFVILAIGVGMVFAQMDRDRIMSRITDTTGGRLGSTFFVRIAQFGALPLATVIATQFPSINRIFFSWVQPALEALK